MAVRSILHYPNQKLREKTRIVETISQEIIALLDDMAETMYAAPGVGLAAPQIGESLRIFITDTSSPDEPSQLLEFINPEILSMEGKQESSEGCLSFPGLTADVNRSTKIVVRAINRNGESFELHVDGFLSVAIQHEYDHLEGVLMIDRLGILQKRLAQRRMQKHHGR